MIDIPYVCGRITTLGPSSATAGRTRVRFVLYPSELSLGAFALKLRQLRYFLALAEHRHFGRAARLLHIAQPSLSQQIRALELELNTTLFERSSRPVSLTPDGEALLPYARRMLALAADFRAELDDRRNLVKGSIRLGATPTLGAYLLPDLLRQFTRKYPGLELTIVEDGSDRLAQALDEGHLDLAVLVEAPEAPTETFQFLLRERIVVGLPDAHHLADRAEVSLAELENDDFILCREGYHLRGMTLQACSDVGFVPRVSVRGTDVNTALRFVQAGLGVTLLPEFMARSARIAAPLITDPPLHRNIGIAWNPQRYLSRAASALHAFLQEKYEGLQPR